MKGRDIEMDQIRKHTVRIPDYTMGEEICNAVTHGLGALLSAAALTLLAIRAQGTLPIITVTLFGVAMIQLYTVSCVYHALSPNLSGKKVMRVIDHCNVYLLVFGTYLPVALLGVGGAEGWILLGVVAAFTALGIVLTAIDVDRYQVASVVCHLLSGWSILIGVPALLRSIGPMGMLYMVLGGVMYSIGAVLYGVGKSKRYRHSVFHVFCLLGTFCHFWAVYQYLL